MSIEIIVGWMVSGIFGGLLMYLVVPGQQYFSLAKIMGLGVAGAVVGGFLFSSFWARGGELSWLTSRNIYSWLFATLCAALVVWIYPYALPRQWHRGGPPVESGR